MTTDLPAALQQHFGFDVFRPGQKKVIEHLLEGHSAAAVFPTGGGKSLCYQLPALLLPGLTLVVSPLIALMKDQIDALVRRDIDAARLDSTLDLDEYRSVMDRVRSGQLRLLYVAPERFTNERFRQTIAEFPISLFAVDEAHCISEWGHNFRPDYLKLAGFARAFEAERVLALTATATPRVLDDICAGFDIAAEHAERTGFYRPNLTLLTTPVSASDRDQTLQDVLERRESGSTIVYVTLQRTAEAVAARLQHAGMQVRAYHAGMKDEDRSSVQDWFMASTSAVVVATIAFGMGIDKVDIRNVYHYNLPKSLENYAQEIGRAGRDEKTSICDALVCADDLTVLENFVYGDTPDPRAVRGLVDDVFHREAEFDVSLYELSATHDIRPLVLRTLLTRLELDDFLDGGTPFYSEYKFKPLMDSAQILEQFEGSRRKFLADLFRHARKGRVWFQLDAGQAAASMGVERERVIRSLDWLGDQRMVEVQAGGMRNRYRRLLIPDDPQALADELHTYNLQREEAEVGRLRQVLDLFGLDGCRTQSLAAHFGEILASPCGHCSHCLGDTVAIAPRAVEQIPSDLTQKIGAVVDAAPDVLSTPRSIARFLCGLSSPRLRRARLAKDPVFGMLDAVPFPDVLKWTTEYTDVQQG